VFSSLLCPAAGLRLYFNFHAKMITRGRGQGSFTCSAVVCNALHRMKRRTIQNQSVNPPSVLGSGDYRSSLRLSENCAYASGTDSISSAGSIISLWPVSLYNSHSLQEIKLQCEFAQTAFGPDFCHHLFRCSAQRLRGVSPVKLLNN
jgi:hypothetical protein